MIKTLQKKFIVTAMLAISTLLVGLLGAINGANAYISVRQTSETLDILLENEISSEPQPPHISDKDDKESDDKEKRDPKPEGLFSPVLTEDSKMSAVFFVCYVEEDGTISKVDVSHIASVSASEAEELMERVQQTSKTKKTEGKIEHFRYRSAVFSDQESIADQEGTIQQETIQQETVYLFLDTSAQTYSIIRLLLLSLLLGTGCWLLMLCLVTILSRKAIRPIAANIERQKQFITDAGHEIKTPLAIILANTDAMELYNGETKWSKRIREQTVRLNGLMQNLLTLSKIDESNVAANRESFSFSNMVEETADMFQQTMELRGLSIEKQIQPELMISADKELINRLVSILLDNAVKYASENSTIQLSAFQADKKLQLTITNHCPTLPPCPPDKLFDRFYRGDSARTQKNGGYGIGLSAARSIAEAHNGTITASYSSGSSNLSGESFSDSGKKSGDNQITFHVKLAAG